jgi:transglutaminase-like putative cysteine protease
LFILFPRVSGPLWNLPQDAYRGRTGLSDEMSPGAISQLSQTDTVAFRVQFTGTVPSPEQLYWRGPVLWDYDGHTWKGIAEIPSSTFDYTPEGAGMDYTVTLEPHGKRWLFALDLPASLPVETMATTSFELLRAQPVNEVLRYQVRSYLYYRTGELSSWERQRALQLPAQVNPRARTLAAEWRKRDPDPAALVRAALALFRKEPFYYTLTPPLLGKEGVDDFLFNTRQGFCEHYAGSFVFLMRAAGVPARVITGYQGGERNALDNYLIVRQSDAHAWAEVWLEDWGWVRVDPTAAVAPERVEQGLYAAVASPKTLPILMGRHNLWIQQLGLGWDALNKAWNKWVLTYGPERQQQFLSVLGLGIGDWRGMAFAMVLALGSLGLVFAGLRTLQRRAAVDPVIQAYQCFCAKLARYGLVRDAHEGPLDFAERVARHHPDLAYQARLISQLYATLRFGRAYQQDSVKRLRRLVKDFKV